ncbi:inorganic diphosphatase [Gammaproteobacteria bacterium]|nr:inorganic diphosphatase [Gammaproteobacteria bacterium]
MLRTCYSYIGNCVFIAHTFLLLISSNILANYNGFNETYSTKQNLSSLNLNIDKSNDMRAISKEFLITMVVEIPAGTNKKIEFNKGSNSYEIDRLNGLDRIIDFLPYPANYGFITSTLMSKKHGGDGDALDVLLISESIAIGEKIEIVPIGLLVLRDNGEIDTKIIAIPLKKELRVIRASTYEELVSEYPAIKYIIEKWFLSYKGNKIVEFIRWGNEIEAIKEIDRWRINL